MEDAGPDRGDSDPTGLSESQLIARLARRHYLEDAAKVELAKEFGISRFRIARLLQRGRDEGIIRIEVIEPTTDLPTVSRPLGEALGLRHVRVIGSSGGAADVRDQLGAMGAQLLLELVRPGDIVGIGWGRTMSEVAEHLHDLPPITMVQISGSITTSHSSSPIEPARSAVEKAGGCVDPLPAPLYVGDAEERRRVLEAHSTVRGQYDHLNVALVSIGTWDPPDTQVDEALPPLAKERLDQVHPAGEVVGIWFDADGRIVAPEITRLCVTLETHHLRATPAVITVAAGTHKAGAIIGAVRTGLIDGLVTDRATAEAMLALLARED